MLCLGMSHRFVEFEEMSIGMSRKFWVRTSNTVLDNKMAFRDEIA